MSRLALMLTAAVTMSGLCSPVTAQETPKPEQPAGAADAATTTAAQEQASGTDDSAPKADVAEAKADNGAAADESAAATETAEPPLPRNVRWKRMDVNYLRANVRHPALYWDSVQEKVRHDDRPSRTLPGAAASCMYEIIQFPVQLGLTPVLMTIKPPWTVEASEP